MPETSVARDIGELLWFGFHGTTLPAELKRQLERGECGAVVLFKRNLVIEVTGSPVGTGPGVAQEVIDLDALVELNQALHAAAPKDSPLLITIDQEGGAVQRVRAPATQWPPMLSHDRFPDPEDTTLAEAVGHAMGRELAALGIDVDYAPVLDVHTNAKNPVIGDRAFGQRADEVSRRALAFAHGLESGGVLGCGKHFPGHGDTETDSHLELPRIDHAWERLEQVELAPFAAAAAASLPMLMTAHVVFSAFDDRLPATLSPKVVGELLRERLRYRGVVVSDDLDMKAIVDNFGVGDAAVAAIRAGCDALLCCRDATHQQQASEALARAASTDSSFRARVGEAADRVRLLKARSVGAKVAAGPAPRDLVGSFAHRRLADRLAGTGSWVATS